MGWILSKFRKTKSTMEVLTKLETEINNIIEFKASTAQTQKRVVGHLVTYSIVIYLLVAIFTYFKLFPAARTAKDQLFLLLPFLISPFLIWGLRRFLTWYYHRKIVNNEKKLEDLKKKKTRILDEVMETETYKVAKEILDKFGDKSQQSGVRGVLPGVSGVMRQAPGDSQLRRRNVGAAGTSLNQSLPVKTPGPQPQPSSLNQSLVSVKPSSVSNKSMMTPNPGPGGPNPPSSHASPVPGTRPAPTMGGRPGPPLPRPILPRERGYLDKFVEFLVGDGPANRYALICRQCESHNGMALREEFEYIAFRCCYCYYWNPARKQRPVAPRLAAAADRPVPGSTSSQSSGSDDSTPPSAAGSRRPSVSKIEESDLLKHDDEQIGDVKTEEENVVKTEEENSSSNDDITKVETEVNVSGDNNQFVEQDNKNEEMPRDDNENTMDIDS